MFLTLIPFVKRIFFPKHIFNLYVIDNRKKEFEYMWALMFIPLNINLLKKCRHIMFTLYILVERKLS